MKPPKYNPDRDMYIRRFSALAILFTVLLVSTFHAQARELPDFTELASSASPAVVNISSRQKAATPKGMPRGFRIPEMPEDSPFNDLFKHFFGEGIPFEGLPDEFGEREAQSLGSGFIISEDGYILTNHHVIEGADEIEVRLSDRRYYAAEVIGSDKRSDVAVLKIDADGDLPTVTMGKSHDLKVGEWVLAIGSPFGFDHTVTAGIVSAKGRNLPTDNYVPFIQTDVAINPGNSGGPLFNLDGEVVGINSQIYSRTGGFMGLSFAIPIELAINVSEQLREHGTVSRGYLGVLIQDVDRDLAESFGLDHPRGALVSRVLPGSPAEAAGLQPGDIIVAFNGTELRNSSQLPPLVGATKVEQEARVTILRNGSTEQLSVRIGRLPDEEPDVIPARAVEEPKANALGLITTDVDTNTRKELKLRDGGALVKDIDAGAGRDAGLRPGDVIQMYDGQRVQSAAHLAELIEKSRDKRSVAVLIHRRSGPMFLALRLND